MEAQGPALNGRIHKKDLSRDPLEQFQRWFEEAKERSGLPNPNAMCLCTISPEGWPEGRPVLLKQADAAGFVFYTNFKSDKGRSLAALPKAELVFHWDPLGRQVRVRGAVIRVTDAEADAYFASRPRGNQIGAWASQQSQPVESRDFMDQVFHDMEQKFEGKSVPRPAHWSGYRLVPNRIEFWQADPVRFHDRFRYSLDGETWTMTRLFP